MRRILRNIDKWLKIDRFVRASDAIRARALYVVSAAFIAMQCLNLVAMSFIYGRWTVDHWIVSIAIGFFAVLILSIRHFNRFTGQAAAIVGLTMVAIFSSAAGEGTGINSAALPIIPLSILFAGLISGWRLTLLSGITALGLIAVLYSISMGLPPGHQFDPQIFAERNQARALQAGIVCGLTTMMMVFFSRTLDGIFAKLENSIESNRSSEKSKTDFLSNMSREIRVPLTGVHGMSGLLLKTDLDSQQHQYASIIQECSNSLVTLVEDIMDFAKLDADKLPIQHQPFSVRDLAKTLIYLHYPATARKHLKLRLQVGKKVPKLVAGDAARIRQVINTLLANAVRFTHDGEIILSLDGKTTGSDYQLHVAVSDTGIGISKAELVELFDRFKSLYKEDGVLGDGNAEGLAMAKALITAMGGTLDVHSIPNQGSRFSFTVPLGLVEEKSPVPHAGQNNEAA